MIFSMYIPDTPGGDLGAQGFVMFGGYDYNIMDGGIEWVNTFNDFMWQLHMMQATLGYQRIPFEQDEHDAYTKVFEPDPNQ